MNCSWQQRHCGAVYDAWAGAPQCHVHVRASPLRCCPCFGACSWPPLGAAGLACLAGLHLRNSLPDAYYSKNCKQTTFEVHHWFTAFRATSTQVLMHRVLYLKHQAVGSWHQPEASLSLPPSAAGIHLFKAVPALRGMCRSVVDVGRFLTSSSWALARLLRYRCCILSVSEPSVVRTMTQPLPSRPMTSPSMPVSCCACRFPVQATTTLQMQRMPSDPAPCVHSECQQVCSSQHAGQQRCAPGRRAVKLVYLSPILNSFPLVWGCVLWCSFMNPASSVAAGSGEGTMCVCTMHADGTPHS